MHSARGTMTFLFLIFRVLLVCLVDIVTLKEHLFDRNFLMQRGYRLYALMVRGDQEL